MSSDQFTSHWGPARRWYAMACGRRIYGGR